MICEYHLCSKVLVGRQKKFCSKNCCQKHHIANNRRNNKKKLVTHFGGACVICGYDKYVGALEFHHLDETNKDFGISVSGNSWAYDKLLKEAEKCILVCVNCHRELHGNIIQWPVV